MPAVAKQDLLVHLHTGEGEDLKGNKVEMTEGLNLKAGDEVPVDQLATYQKEALADPETDGGHFSSMITQLSDKEHSQLLASREESRASISNADTRKAGEAEVTKTEAPDVNATDGALAFAEEQGVDISQVQGSGEGGRISKADVEKHIETKEA